MSSRKGYFKRVDPQPYRVRLDLFGPITTVQQNEVIFAEVSTFKDVIGFSFVGWTAPSTDISPDIKTPTTINGYANMVVVRGERQEPPHKEYLRKLEAEKPTKINFVEDTVVEKVPELVDEVKAEVVTEKTEMDIENERTALLNYLGKLEGKKWFIMKKEETKGYLDRLKLDYSHLPNSKNELIKFLREYIDGQKTAAL
jgi:hypothetical protein